MTQVKVLVVTGNGTNCERESAHACRMGGFSRVDIATVWEWLHGDVALVRYRLLVFPGGFLDGDDLGSAKAQANRFQHSSPAGSSKTLLRHVVDFVNDGGLILGICNGFQVMVNLGIVPGLSGSGKKVEAALEHNSSFRYQCRWVDLAIEKETPSVFTGGIDTLHIPVAHGEGNFFATDDVLSIIEEEKLVTMRYVLPDGEAAKGEFPFNPNGSINDIASICDPTGRIMGMMPHPERGMFFTQRDDWTLIREQYAREGKDLPEESGGMAIFRNAVGYFA